MKEILLIFLLLLPLANTCVTTDRPDSRSAVRQAARSDTTQWYTVTRVVDGDTFWIDDGSGEGVKIRLIGIDAPERRNTGTKLKGYYGDEASLYLTKMLQGQKVRLEYDAGRYDRYSRTLAYAWLEDGTFVNAILVKEGYADVMTIPPNVKYAERFKELAAKARRQKKGLWKENPSSK